MTTPAVAGKRRGGAPEGAAPAALVLLIGLVVVVLRPPLPIDETRYLEVFRESLHGSPFLLRLLGEPYAEKPPLLFWLGRLLATLGVPALEAMRCVPALASAGTVLLVARLGKRAGVEHAAWIQAALWLPGLASQFLFFDPLLAATIWAAVEAWTRCRDGQVWAWSSAALLAKGPVAFLFLIPLFWSTAPLRDPGPHARRRAAVALLLALVPLAAWALTAAALGGREFANALLWERWAGRVVKAADHARPFLFYVPVVLIGALPATAMLFTRRRSGEPLWSRRLARTLLLILVLFTLISGKQAHYLVPTAPALALVLAEALVRRPSAPRALRLGVRVQLGALVLGAFVGPFVVQHHVHRFGPHGVALAASAAPLVVVGLTALVAAIALSITWRDQRPVAWIRASAIGASLALIPVHWLAGELVYPHELARALSTAPAEIAYLGSSRHGLYALLAGTLEMERLPDESALAPWARAHPDGIVMIDPADLKAPLAPELEITARDMAHHAQVQVLRRRAP